MTVYNTKAQTKIQISLISSKTPFPFENFHEISSKQALQSLHIGVRTVPGKNT